MKEIGIYTVHEMASRLPMMSDNQLKELGESILTQSQLEPIIVTNDGKTLIDGRNRMLAITNLNKGLKGSEITPWTITLRKELNRIKGSDEQKRFDGVGLEDAIDRGDEEAIIKELIILKNVMRRHLTDWEKFMTLNAVTETKKQGGDGSNQHAQKSKNLLNKSLLNSEGLSLDEQADKLGWSNTQGNKKPQPNE